nr:hypothetical protein [Clostridioides difficile]
MFTTAPVSIEAIEPAGLPSARITEFIILDSIKIGKNSNTILKYSTAYPMLFSDAPNKVKSDVLNGKNSAINIMLVIKVTITPVPIALWEVLESFLPWQILRYAAHPSPKHQANACAIINIGNTTPVAALPRAESELFPINI